MRLLSLPIALLFALAVVADTNADDNAKGKKKQHAIRGKVEAVTKDKDSGTIAVVIHHKQKGTTTPVVKHEKFKVTPDTTFEMAVRDGKGQIQRKPATFADVKVGEHVAMIPREGAAGVAQRVEIIVHKKAGATVTPKPVAK
jgi:hypothetical protein